MPMATTAVMAVYSSSRSHPMNHPTTSPSTEDPYEYADPALGISPPNSAYERAAQPAAIPATTNEIVTPGPAFVRATPPASVNIPAPMIAPSPMAVSDHRPSDRFS